MPPSVVKTIRDLVYWEYAKLITGRAVGDRKNRPFCMHTFLKLRNGQIHPSTILRENHLLVEEGTEKCTYCGHYKSGLEWEHIIPTSRGGPDTIDNQVLACRRCNAEKGDKCLYDWYGEERKYEIPRLAWGKYLKVIYDLHEQVGTLDSTCSRTNDLDCVLKRGRNKEKSWKRFSSRERAGE